MHTHREQKCKCVHAKYTTLSVCIYTYTHKLHTCTKTHTQSTHTYTHKVPAVKHTRWKVLRWSFDDHSSRSYSPNQGWALWLKVFSHPPWWQQLNECLPIFLALLESTVLSSFSCFKGKWLAPSHASVSRWSQRWPDCWTSLPLVNTMHCLYESARVSSQVLPHPLHLHTSVSLWCRFQHITHLRE